MSVFAKLAVVGSQTMTDSKDRLNHARNYYKCASETLFQLCYEIQVTGRLPNPALLTDAVLQYREARALIEELECRKSTGIAQGVDALASGQR